MKDRKHTTHHYSARCTWSGSTAVGYESYDRTHAMEAPPAKGSLELASDPAFRGNPDLMNPEQLLLVAASSCQLLSFLAVAARARVDVLKYEDEAEGEMPEDDVPVRITRIRLAPRITLAEGTDVAKVRRLVELAHEQCYIANSLKTIVTVDPQIETRSPVPLSGN